MHYVLSEEEMQGLTSRAEHERMLKALDYKTWCLECWESAVKECCLEERQKIYTAYQRLKNKNTAK